MEWRDKGIIIGARAHGETSLIVELMTREHGRYKGVVKGGRSRRQMPLMQPGNRVEAHWRARLSEHIGQYRLEAVDCAAAALMREALSLYALQTVTDYLRLLPERDPYPELYDILPLLLAHFDEPLLAGEIFMRFEMRLLAELGFGLDLTCCAATGRKCRLPPATRALPLADEADTAELIYVSPKSGRAVSREAGEPWKDKLLPLPAFLLSGAVRAGGMEALAEAARLSSFFLSRNVWEPRGLAPPPFRASFLRCLDQAAQDGEE